MALTILGVITAVFKAIPSLKDLWDQIVAAYIEKELLEMHERDRAAIRKAVYGQDQRDLEKQLGNSNAGERSGLPGTDIRTELPGVSGPKKK